MFGTREVYPLRPTTVRGSQGACAVHGRLQRRRVIDAAVVCRLSPEVSVLFGTATGISIRPCPTTCVDSLVALRGRMPGRPGQRRRHRPRGRGFLRFESRRDVQRWPRVFSDPTMYPVGNGTWPHGAHALDFDGDGDRDLIITYDYVSGSPNGAAAFWRNDGTGAFAFVRATPTQGMRPRTWHRRLRWGRRS